MSIADRLGNVPVGVPEKYQKHSVNEGGSGEAATGPVRGDLITEYAEILRIAGLDPEKFEIVGKVHTWTKEQPDREPLHSYFFGWQEINPDGIDLPALYAEFERTPTPKIVPDTGDRSRVVSWADMQLGKKGSRGGTLELLARLEQKRAALRAHMQRDNITHSVFVDAGDPLEGFENVASQMFTNDLSLPQQVDIAATEMWKTLVLLAEFGPVDAVAVPSNHGAWRNGKQSLGKPSDDWGIAMQRRLEFQAELIGLPVTFHRPTDWDESVALDVRGIRMGVHHGHQASEDQMMNWWAGQQHGNQATADCDILLTGHYHHLRVQPSGRSRRTGKSKWWLQSPTLDNGSDWFRNNKGDDSDPGLLVFDITEDGFSLQSLTVL